MQKNFPIIAISTSFVFLMVSSFLFFHFHRQIDTNKNEFQTRCEEWKNEAIRRDEIRKLDNSVKVIEPERAKLDTHFANGSDIVPFLNTVEGLATKANVKAEVTSVDISGNGSGLLVGASAKGTFAGLYKFVTLLENSAYEIEFVGVQMNREAGVSVSSKSPSSTQWNAVLKIKLLSFTS